MNTPSTPWWVDTFSEIESAFTKESMMTAICKATRKLGFDCWAYGTRHERPANGNGSVSMENTYPNGWTDHYLSSRFLDIDPTIQFARRSQKTVLWENARQFGAERLWADAAEFGLNIGIAYPSWDRKGSFGLFTVARAKDHISKSEHSNITPHLAWLSSLTHAKLNTLGNADAVEVRLSARELEVLRWSALGKTASEVAMIVGITTRTVNFHVANIEEKLSVQNKVQAAVRATLLGLI